MGSTRKAITSVYQNNSKTATTVSKTVPSEMTVVTSDIAGTQVYKETPRNDEVYPGVVGGTSRQV